MKFVTPRLTVRPLTPADAPFIFELVNEPPWLAYIGNKGVLTLDDADAYIRKGPMRMYADRGFGLCVVERNDDGRSIGMCGLIKRDTLPDVDLGFAFLQRFWGAGYALEAAAATLAHARNALHLERVVAITTPDNRRSSQLLRKLGFAFEGIIRLDGDESDLELYACTLAGNRDAATAPAATVFGPGG
jgi:RimJ/RimL family protein N-acetyltransferase